jgi:hypothetical protein
LGFENPVYFFISEYDGLLDCGPGIVVDEFVIFALDCGQVIGVIRFFFYLFENSEINSVE